MENKDEEVKLENVGKIELETIDFDKYIGKDVKIESARVYKGEYGLYVKVESEIIDSIEIKGEQVNIKASNVFGLHEDKDGKIGWADTTKLGAFLNDHKVEHYDDLVGLTCKVQTRLSKQGKTFLTLK